MLASLPEGYPLGFTIVSEKLFELCGAEYRFLLTFAGFEETHSHCNTKYHTKKPVSAKIGFPSLTHHNMK